MSGNYCYIKEFFINQMHGSCYDKWSKMGGLPLKEDELQILRVTHPGTLIHTEQIDNGILFIETELDPLEIRLVEIEPRQ
jgi:beta-xylosidase